MTSSERRHLANLEERLERNDYAGALRILHLLFLRKATEKAKATRARVRARKAAKSEKHRLSTKEIRAEVFKRAHALCEVPGCTRYPGHMDHFLGGSGRRRPRQSVETCWALCGLHDYQRTHNVPDASFWNAAFGQHCANHGYPAVAHVVHEPVPRRSA